jgi:hypothetical protein
MQRSKLAPSSKAVFDVSDITNIIKTKNPANNSEYLLLTRQGMYFISIIARSQSEKFLFTLSNYEYSFHRRLHQGALEFLPGNFFVLVNDQKYF